MFDDFLIRAYIAGIGVAFVAGPLGCVLIWRKMAFFSDTLAHAGLLGAALALMLEINLTLTIFLTSVVITLMLLSFQKRTNLSSDAVLGLLSHSALGLGLVLLSFLTWVRFDIMGLLTGEILSVSKLDLALIWCGGGIVLGLLSMIWRPLFAGTVNRDIALAEGMSYERAHLIFMMLLSIVIAIAIKIMGVLLITAMLVIPAAAARSLSTAPEQMVAVATVIGILSVSAGLFGSVQFDTPSGPSIVVACLLFFLLSLTPLATRIRGKAIK